MARRNDNILSTLFEIGKRIPWWLSIVVAISAYFGFRYFATQELPPPSSTGVSHELIVAQVIKTGALLAQYAVPAVLVLGAVAAFIDRLRRGVLFQGVSKNNPSEQIEQLSWQQFEELVHEFFNRQGFKVLETNRGPDGGIDLRLFKDGEKAVVQCKHWKQRKVGVNFIREQFGVLTAEGADRAYVVTSGEFTKEAADFAKGKPISLINGAVLAALIESVSETAPVPAQHIDSILCPKCGSDMTLRQAKRGTSAGQQFYGCITFPKCRGTRSA